MCARGSEAAVDIARAARDRAFERRRGDDLVVHDDREEVGDVSPGPGPETGRRLTLEAEIYDPPWRRQCRVVAGPDLACVELRPEELCRQRRVDEGPGLRHSFRSRNRSRSRGGAVVGRRKKDEFEATNLADQLVD